MPFLDVLVKQEHGKIITSVYTKPMNPGYCLNGRSEYPHKYKDSTIEAYILRALRHCSTWKQMHKEIARATQVLINNDFAERDIKRQTKNKKKKIIDGMFYNKQDKEKKDEIKIFYKETFSTAYKEDESIIQQIVKRNIKPSHPDKVPKLIIYYKTKTTGHLLKNNPAKEKESLQKSHLFSSRVLLSTMIPCSSCRSFLVDVTPM
ncbi:hypothetical protein E2C01_049854 [Portunus trituberculatus]|uniref:Helix-turn-helix domain-containing protein n=1 Tax=Portunus trituberculatus TaxID=210409 RepID=A0A5B7GED2_PORTR|nr:hypothetical protein [Portunus trituberculatus]